MPDDHMDKLIPRNSAMPTRESRDYSTHKDNQSKIVINILEGDSDKASENQSLGSYDITDIPAGPAGS